MCEVTAITGFEEVTWKFCPSVRWEEGEGGGMKEEGGFAFNNV